MQLYLYFRTCTCKRKCRQAVTISRKSSRVLLEMAGLGSERRDSQLISGSKKSDSACDVRGLGGVETKNQNSRLPSPLDVSYEYKII